LHGGNQHVQRIELAPFPAKEARIMKIWIVVADEREALFYNVSGAERRGIGGEDGSPNGRRANGRFQLVLRLTNPQARPDRELESDRPGRAFSSSTGQRHAIDGERSSRRSGLREKGG
jgi:hypothetical protein